MRVLLIAATALGLMAGSAGAANTNTTPSPAQLAAAREVVEASGAANVLGSDAFENSLFAQIQKETPNLNAETLKTIQQVLHDEIAAYKPTLLQEVAALYAQHFSEADLEALTAFYRSETGQHLVAQTPAIAVESSRLAMPLMIKIMEDLKARLGDSHSADTQKKSE